ncbi:unnamed protein product [Zymoseptoria tritici ST99CH_1A5]|uniref:Knr4/Smi1-like domain-containing protein n=3 Tax=Zymoseptoria tritici TaxID=1047171 RepID=A0A2H1GSW1_ZYMTR|nr:unnamed protein product [Zymoseptoria tritici ST99CH_1E4]SMR59485.1 unnamed protein product [Zymoseptoria tritici ST99CH_3D1]SMY26682.1 unnamed protein product [Zymoseptoria tritici ST99CH_1A5]
MTSAIASQWRSFWHTMTSNDRHAGPDSPYRSNNHQPISQSRSAPLSSNNNSALESRTDLDLESGSGFVSHNAAGTSSPTGYASPRRQSLQRQGSAQDGKMDSVGQGEIQMQSFSDGLPPPPPVAHSWKRIDRWLEDNYEEVFENMCPGATINDVNELEHELDCTLPQEVRESLQVHDGQERGGRPTGVIFGCMLLDCEEIVQEWKQWRTVNEQYLSETRTFEIPQAPLKAFAGSSSSAVPVAQSQSSGNPQWRTELLDKQDSQPPNAIQKAYAHPAWIPLARDWGGNNIAIDLAPGPAGRWGQVILMGRDYDCKYVISRSWSAFLATLGDDMHTDKWFIDEDTLELKLREFKQQGVEPAYIDILRWRSDQKFGRRRPKRPLRVNSSPSTNQNGFSPYGSPTKEDRGRSPNRYSNGKAPAHHAPSPRGIVGSPLARVTEESALPSQNPLTVDTTFDQSRLNSSDKLIPGIDTPGSARLGKGEGSVGANEGVEENRVPNGIPKSRLGNTVSPSDGEGEEVVGLGLKDAKETKAGAEASGEMQDVELEGEMRDVKI